MKYSLAAGMSLLSMAVGQLTNSSTTFSATATANLTASVSATSSAPISTATGFTNGTFVLKVAVSGSKVRRQAGAGQYLAADGSLTSDCSSAVSYVITNGQLSVSGSPNIVSSMGQTYTLFSPTSDPSGETTAFSAVGTLTWSNAAFIGGQASFCVINNAVYASFAAGTPCTNFVTLAPVFGGCPTTTSSAVPAPTTINNYYNNITYNNITYNININIDPSLFGTGNYYAPPGPWYYYLPCPVCPPVQVCKADNTYAHCPCPVCPPVVYQLTSAQCPGASTGNVTSAGTTCVSCPVAPAEVAKQVTVISVSSTPIAVPTNAAASISSLAAASGVPAAQQAAQSAVANAVTIQASGTGAAAGAPSAVVNVASSVPVTVAQTTAGPATFKGTGVSVAVKISSVAAGLGLVLALVVM